MSSLRLEGIVFRAYPNDHPPRHVHGFYAEVEVIVNLLPDGSVDLADREDAIRPADASRSDVRHILNVAAKNFGTLIALGRSIMASHEVRTTDAKIDAALQTAADQTGEPLAQSVEYVARLNLLIVSLSNGRRLVLPVEDLQGLEHATHKQLQHYELVGRGTGISFPELDADFYVPALIEGVYGTRRWMSELGRRGGSASSEAKRVAAQANGAKGGRPRKTAVAA